VSRSTRRVSRSASPASYRGSAQRNELPQAPPRRKRPRRTTVPSRSRPSPGSQLVQTAPPSGDPRENAEQEEHWSRRRVARPARGAPQVWPGRTTARHRAQSGEAAPAATAPHGGAERFPDGSRRGPAARNLARRSPSTPASPARAPGGAPRRAPARRPSPPGEQSPQRRAPLRLLFGGPPRGPVATLGVHRARAWATSSSMRPGSSPPPVRPRRSPPCPRPLARPLPRRREHGQARPLRLTSGGRARASGWERRPPGARRGCPGPVRPAAPVFLNSRPRTASRAGRALARRPRAGAAARSPSQAVRGARASRRGLPARTCGSSADPRGVPTRGRRRRVASCQVPRRPPCNRAFENLRTPQRPRSAARPVLEIIRLR